MIVILERGRLEHRIRQGTQEMSKPGFAQSQNKQTNKQNLQFFQKGNYQENRLWFLPEQPCHPALTLTLPGP